MQTFLPTTDIKAIAKMLDGPRLRKQRVEAYQILSTLRDPVTLEDRRKRGLPEPKGKGWSNHPAARMWAGHERLLKIYYNVLLAERPTKNGKLRPLIDLSDFDQHYYPAWWGNPALHASHRSRLHYKGTIDLLAKRIRLQNGVRSANAWLECNGYSELNVLTRSERDKIHGVLDELGIPPITEPNWYDQWGWSEANTYKPYMWPHNSNTNLLYEGTRYDH